MRIWGDEVRIKIRDAMSGRLFRYDVLVTYQTVDGEKTVAHLDIKDETRWYKRLYWRIFGG